MSTALHPAHAFLGSWRLLPEHSRYECGEPPREATYTLTADEAGVAFDVVWTDALGQHQHIRFHMPFGDGPLGRMELVDERTLDTLNPAARPGAASHARRFLSEDGRRMTVTQSGTSPEGLPFSNVTLYERVS